MQPDFWLDRWRAAQIGFHQAATDRHLMAYWPNLKLPASSSVFVPLCGKSLDLLWLNARGHSVAGVELSPIALESFCMEHGIPARRRVLADFDVYQAERLALFRGDFFNAFNHTNLDPPRLIFGPSFGLINASAPARQIQLGARLTW